MEIEKTLKANLQNFVYNILILIGLALKTLLKLKLKKFFFSLS